MKIAMTGANGHMGVETLSQTLALPFVEFVRVLVSNKKKNEKLVKKWKKQYKGRIQILRGSVKDERNAKNLVTGVDVVIHMAAVIPPASDSNFQASEECNLYGTMALVDAVKKCDAPPKFIHISTVAVYGNRNEKHPFGRVGDPLLPSPLDTYAMHKVRAERYVLDAELPSWVILRQTAMLHPDMMKCNISDGLMFHTALNAPLEWTTARDSGLLISRIIEREYKGEIPHFWRHIYNIGQGAKGRCTGYDTFNDGFMIIGGSAEKFFKPNYFSARNFHGMWFADSPVLEEMFHYQRDGEREYWQEIGRHHKIYKLGRLVPPFLIKFFLFRRLLKHPNSPMEWVKRKDEPRVVAHFGSLKKAREMSKDWKDYKLISKGDFGDFEAMKDEQKAKNEGKLVSLGYDEEKSEEEWTMQDLQSAASFRGGRVNGSVYEGDPHKKIFWKCHEGHVFEATPYTILKGGHWCPACAQPAPWDFDLLAKHSPFHAQIWYDSHSPDERNIYDFENGMATLNNAKVF